MDEPDAIFSDPRLARLYDPLDPDRSDLDAYVAMVREFAARSVLDLGCGTGVLARELASRGIDVVAADPASASIDVARSKSGAERVRWHVGDATTLPPLSVDLSVMTANVAQVFVTDESFVATLTALAGATRRGGHVVFEVRDPARRAWTAWTRDRSHTVTDVDGVGVVEHWVDVVEVALPLVTFRWTFVVDGEVLVSDSTLSFRDRSTIERCIGRSGLSLVEVRDAPDRPDQEWVFVCVARGPGREGPEAAV